MWIVEFVSILPFLPVGRALVVRPEVGFYFDTPYCPGRKNLNGKGLHPKSCGKEKRCQDLTLFGRLQVFERST